MHVDLRPPPRLKPAAFHRESNVSKRVLAVMLAGMALLLAPAAFGDGREPLQLPSPDFNGVKALARQLAMRPYEDHRQALSRRLSELNYDQLQQIVFDEHKSVWRRERLPFQLQVFHPGGSLIDQINLGLVDGEEISDVPFSRDFFIYPGSFNFSWMDFRGAKFAGFRVLYPLNRPNKLDEVVVFQGASYYRAVAAGLTYGLSARALAINCGETGAEEFPRFRDFWVERPDREGRMLRVWGVLDSPSLAGAVEFSVHPGSETVTRVRLALYPRVDVPRYGIAPLTSMYWFGKNTQRRFDEVRPEVHDSDGLQIETGAGEWLWRPLDNTGKLRLAAFADKNPRGFGLIQREQNPACYEDLHAQYQRRPSAWVRPGAEWGAGALRLVEIPTDSEFSDNIVAFWAPATPLKAGQMAEFSYDVVWSGEKSDLLGLGRVVATRSGAIAGRARVRRFTLDFACPGLEQQGSTFNPEVVVSALHGRLSNRSDEYNLHQHTWRVAFDVTADNGAEAVELRACLSREGSVCTETWTYCWTP